jgi:hypothetical protein
MAYERKTIDIFISDELRDFLSQIAHDSVVASLLLKRRHVKEDLVDEPVNYISISSVDKSKISYLTQERINSLPEDTLWNSSRRFQAKPGGFISKVFKDIPAREVEKFSNFFRSAQKGAGLKLKVVRGREIKHYYSWESYKSDRGTLGASCMKHDSCQGLLNIYSDNTNEVSMLVLVDSDGLLVGRALLWDFDSYKIMDRIYTICDEDYAYQFKKWAGENGYLYKSEQNWYNTLFFDSVSKKNQELKLHIKLNDTYSYYPYMDTFKFVDNNGNLYNYQPSCSFRTLCSTDGSRQSSDYLRFDGINHVFRYHHDAVWVAYKEFYTSGSNVQWSETNDQYILHKDCFYSEEVQDYIFNEENDEFNNKSSIQKRIEYIENRNSRRRKSKSVDWLQSVISNSNYDLSNSETLSDLYQRITERAGYNEYINTLNSGTQIGIDTQSEQVQLESEL